MKNNLIKALAIVGGIFIFIAVIATCAILMIPGEMM